MSIEQRQYDSKDLQVGEVIIIPPNMEATDAFRISGHYRLPTGEFPDYYIDIRVVCYYNDQGGYIELFNPIDGEKVHREINGLPVRFETRDDYGTPGAVEWHHVRDNGVEI